MPESVTNVLQLCGGRKFLLSASIVATVSFLLLHGDISAMIYRDLIIATAGVYIAGNVSQKVFGGEQQP